MQEHITQPVPAVKRINEITHASREDRLIRYIGELIALAYEAGQHNLICGSEPPEKISLGIGSSAVKARMYAKDKGFYL